MEIEYKSKETVTKKIEVTFPWYMENSDCLDYGPYWQDWIKVNEDGSFIKLHCHEETRGDNHWEIEKGNSSLSDIAWNYSSYLPSTEKDFHNAWLDFKAYCII